MMVRLIERGERIAGVRREAVVRDLAAAVDLPAGVTAGIESAGVVLSGRGLRARMLRDARLREIGLLAKGLVR